jgi:CubicO group peptidase (beta-lactamase class C family)
VSKSIIGCVCGVLADRGVIDLDAHLTDSIPELAGSGYEGATVRHVLDMRSGIAFSEDYLDTNAEVRQLEQVIGWAPRRTPDLPNSMYEWLATLKAKTEHGGPFEYRSCETDVLGWVCERASGTRMPELLGEALWGPLGTEFDVDAGIDSAGAVLHDGGLAAALRDLARFGQLLADGGTVDGRRVLPSWWIEDSLRGGSDSRQAFADSPTDSRLPGGMYRNQFWVPYPDEEVLLCLGIHGQLIYVDCRRNVVGVKLSSWPYPQDAAKFLDTLAVMKTLATSLG